MSQIFSMSGMVTDDTEAFIEDLRCGLKSKCLYCGNELVGKRADAKYCNQTCYTRHTTGKYKHDEVPTDCAWCGNEIAGRRHGAKYCDLKCRVKYNARSSRLKK